MNHPIPTRMRTVFNSFTRELFHYERFRRVLNLGCGHDIDREGGCYSDYFIADEIFRVDINSTTEYAEQECVFSGGRKMANPVDVFASANELPFADASFDLVFCNWAFHDFDREKAIKEILRVLTYGGKFFCTFCRPPESFMMDTYNLLKEHFQLSLVFRLVLLERLDGRDGSAVAFYGTRR